MLGRTKVLLLALFAFAGLSGCKNPKPYRAMIDANGADIGYIAAFSDLLAKGSGAKATESDHIAADFARDRIATRAKSAASASADATPETAAVAERLRGLSDACTVTAKDDSEAAKKAVSSCAASFEKLRSALDGVKAPATKQGIPEGDLPSLDPSRASDEGKKAAGPMREALMPSKEEERITKLWDDPKASEEDLFAACKAFANVHGWKSKQEDKAGDSEKEDKWEVSLMMLRDPIVGIEYRNEPPKNASWHRLRGVAQQCVVMTTMKMYGKSGDRCTTDKEFCQTSCLLVKGASAERLKESMTAYGPKSMLARVDRFWAACSVAK